MWAITSNYVTCSVLRKCMGSWHLLVNCSGCCFTKLSPIGAICASLEDSSSVVLRASSCSAEDLTDPCRLLSVDSSGRWCSNKWSLRRCQQVPSPSCTSTKDELGGCTTTWGIHKRPVLKFQTKTVCPGWGCVPLRAPWSQLSFCFNCLKVLHSACSDTSGLGQSLASGLWGARGSVC